MNKKIIIISIIAVALVVAIILIAGKGSTKVYTDGEMVITIIDNKKVTVVNQGVTMAEEAELIDIPIPASVENPKDYSRFVKVNINGGDVEAGFSKDKKTLYVGNIEYKLVEE